MAVRVSGRDPGSSGYQTFTSGVRSLARKATTRKAVVETVTERVPVSVPARIPDPVHAGEPDVLPESPPEPETTTMGRDPDLKPTREQTARWARFGGAGVLGCLMWAVCAASSDPLVSAAGTLVAVVAVPVLLVVVFNAVLRTGLWLTSQREKVSHTPPLPVPAASAAAPAPQEAETEYQERQVERKVLRESPMDPDWAVQRAMAALAASGYGATTAVPGLPLPHWLVNHGVGAKAEVLVGDILENQLGDEWDVSHDLEVYGKGARTEQKDVSANIDHLLVGPGGTIMVDTKSWAGRLEVTGRGPRRRLTNTRGDAESSKVRAKSPKTLVYEANAVDAGTGACQVDLIVIAVTNGEVDGGILEVPPPEPESGCAPVPIVAVSVAKLVGFLKELPEKKSTAGIRELIGMSDRIGV